MKFTRFKKITPNLWKWKQMHISPRSQPPHNDYGMKGKNKMHRWCPHNTCSGNVKREHIVAFISSAKGVVDKSTPIKLNIELNLSNVDIQSWKE